MLNVEKSQNPAIAKSEISFPQYNYRVFLLFFIMIIMFSFEFPKRFSDMS
jgi:hypothetical protein